MSTQLEERLRRYGETFERAAVRETRTQREAGRGRVHLRPRRLVSAIAAAGVVLTTAAVIAVIVRPGDNSTVAPRREPPPPPSLGIGRVWPDTNAAGFDRSGPDTTARAFTEDVVGEAPTEVTPDPNAPYGPTFVEVTLATGTSFPVLTVPGQDGWSVVQAGGGIGYTVEPDKGLLPDRSGITASRVDYAWRDDAGVHTRTGGPELANGPLPVEVHGWIHSAVVVLRDDAGTPVAVVGGQLGPPPPETVPTSSPATTTTMGASDVPIPAEVRVLVLNAGQPAGSALNKTNQLVLVGYNTLAPSNHPITRNGTAVQCKPGFENAAAGLAAVVGEGATVEPFDEASAPPESAVANCLVYLGQ